MIEEQPIDWHLEYAHEVLTDPDQDQAEMVDEIVSFGSVEEHESYLIDSRKKELDRYEIDGGELWLIVAMIMAGVKDRQIRKKLLQIRRDYPITHEYPEGFPPWEDGPSSEPTDHQGPARIFLSYSSKDGDYATMLTEAFEGFGLPVWNDSRIEYGAQWPRVLQEHLDACGVFVVIMTANSYASDWVHSEVSRAKRKGKTIFPLLLEGHEPWLSVESTQYVDVRHGKLPPPTFFVQVEQALGG